MNDCDGVALASRMGQVREAPPRYQDHEQGFEECAPIVGSVFRQGGASFAVAVAVVAKQLSRKTRRLLRGDANVSRGCRATEDCRQPIADGRKCDGALTRLATPVRAVGCTLIPASKHSRLQPPRFQRVGTRVVERAPLMPSLFMPLSSASLLASTRHFSDCRRR